MAPIYLEEDIKRYVPTILHMQLREGAGRDQHMFDVADPKSKTLIEIMKREWNGLPLSIRKSETLTSFKRKLKSTLISEMEA